MDKWVDLQALLATCSTQQTTGMQQTTDNPHHAAHSRRQATRNMQQRPRNRCSMQHATCNRRQAICNTQRTTLQHMATCNRTSVQHASDGDGKRVDDPRTCAPHAQGYAHAHAPARIHGNWPDCSGHSRAVPCCAVLWQCTILWQPTVVGIGRRRQGFGVRVCVWGNGNELGGWEEPVCEWVGGRSRCVGGWVGVEHETYSPTGSAWR